LAPWEGSVATSDGGDAAPGGKSEETRLVGLTQILLDQKMKKINAVNSVAINRR
jgi:hypothetical protein